MTYERPRSLRRCLESLTRLSASPESFEVLVVDDGSTADNEEVIGDFAGRLWLRYRRIPHRGVSAARNAGLAAASGELVAFIADDYTLPREYLRTVEEFFERHPDAAVLTFNIRSRGRSPARHVQQLYHELVLLGNANAAADRAGVIRTFTLPASRAAVFRREVLLRLGPFDESLLTGEDGEMGERLARHGVPIHFLPDSYVDHWEEKGLSGFLRQRTMYARSFYELWRRRQPEGPVPRRWGLLACVREITARMRSWAVLSRRSGRLKRFLLLVPGLVLFLSCFYGTLYRLNRADLRRS